MNDWYHQHHPDTKAYITQYIEGSEGSIMGKSACSGLQPSGCLPWPFDILLNLLVLLIWPSQGALSGLVSLCIPTMVEKEDPVRLLVRRLTLGPMYAAFFLLTLPVALCLIPMRCVLSYFKRPFQYSVLKKDHTQAEEEFMVKSMLGSHLDKYQFGIATGNLCLLPEFLARINIISHSGQRAKSIGERLVVDQFFYGEVPESALGLAGNRAVKNDVETSKKQGFTGGLATHFPRLDFLCLQEVFDWNYNKTLRAELHKV